MAKRAVVLHGTDGSPDSNWFMWLKVKLEAQGYDVWVPQLPNCDKPNRNTYGDFLFGSGWGFADNIVIGHSSGAVEVLNLLMDERMPHLKMAIMVSAWAGGMPAGYDDESVFASLFPPQGFDFSLIKSRSDHIAFLHGSDDPYCPPEQAQYLANQLNARLTMIQDGQHLGTQFTELPQIWHVIEPLLQAENKQ